MNVLLATLGETPAVVTEAIDVLQAQGIDVHAVQVLTTMDVYAQGALGLLSEHIPRYYKGKVEFWGGRTVKAFHDVDSITAAVEFMQEACAALRDFRKRGANVYVCIAGGRKAMSALMALAVQFYGARMLFHVLVMDPTLEEAGHYLNLRNQPTKEQDRVLHPPLDEIRLVPLPFVGLFPLLNEILQGLKGQSVRKEVQSLLEDNGLLERGAITDLGRTVAEILEAVESSPDPREGECEMALAKKEPKEAEQTREWAERIATRFSFVRRIEDIGWREGEPKVKVEPPDRLVVFLPGRRIRGIGFRLFTTARTPGQLERARQEIERWIEREAR